jgi:hypothetical protein
MSFGKPQQLTCPIHELLMRRALAGVLQPSARSGALRPLCERLVGLLEQVTEDIEQRLPAMLQALSSIGRLAPDIFVDHAASVADFVLHVRRSLNPLQNPPAENLRTLDTGMPPPQESLPGA